MKNKYPVFILGMGPGNPKFILPETLELINKSDALIGGKRHLEDLEQNGLKDLIFVEDGLDGAVSFIKKYSQKKMISVLVSGDPGFYSLTNFLMKKCPEIYFEILPGISSMTYLFSKLGMLWHDALIVSLHGKSDVPMEKIIKSHKTVFLTDAVHTPGIIAKKVLSSKVSNKKMIVGENLSYENENIRYLNLEDAKDMEFENLNLVVLINET
ncbi:precorrin-6y C5,15-methyltransferase (decarboxylating) subunit CbiE [Alkalibacter mobilis]|uniref:precorrin-6y C5,15-methyltransferase (decarboxylating) subunit CbiE n=1 Tax=Alkalibacter mobilis TaxID=2787712 RepID=UPI00189EAAAF|nr:precorrin-6y C5,15-methyltransferase (decarboxylating) subunit CbiE [Alkalibacter mobilis]MBF7097173.1 precorrin-6y C5,15-methyltransferase (decarboxylating) subunit CbiE [Alkalibacter mobilis]